MKPNQIKIKNIKTGKQILATVKNGYVYTYGKKHLYCGCTGTTEKTATPMQYNETDGVYCPNCHEKKVDIIQTYNESKHEKEEQEKKLNQKKLANLHLVEMGSDWECGFKYFGLSANIDYDNWLKVKEYFKYYKKGWSNGQELEWDYGEPTGWLTQNPLEVEKILVDIGLIKTENTMKSISEREKIEKQKKENERKERKEKINSLKEKMDTIEKKINVAFNSNPQKRELSDAEAYENYLNPTFGKCTILTYTINDDEIIMCRNMGDFKYGVAIPYSEEVNSLIVKMYDLENELLKL